MAAARRLLFLLPFAPRLDATHGGGKALAQLLSRLATRHRLALAYLRGADEPPLDERLRARCDLVEEVKRPWTGNSIAQRWIRRGRLVLSVVRRKPMWATDWSSPVYAARVRDLVRQWQPDIIQIEFHIMGQYVSALNACQAPRVLTELEPGERAAPYLVSSNSIARLLNHFDRQAWSWFERTVVRQVQAVVVFTENDREAIQRVAPGTCMVRIPLGTEIPEKPLDPIGSLPPSLLFFGSFIHPPNVDAALRLVRTIFPPVQARFPNLELYIVGDQPPPELSRMANANIVVTGRVPDLTSYLNRASVFVAPLRLGGGMRVKVLETLAGGKAIVTSRLAVEGLDLVNGEQIYLAESDVEFCEAITKLLTSPERRVLLANRARAWACSNLSWNQSVAEYEALYSRLLEGSPL
jgi:glycosyltransferase involved in cell wall biosynthesis